VKMLIARPGEAAGPLKSSPHRHWPCRPARSWFVFKESIGQPVGDSMKQTYTGGCHYGAIRYEADMDLKQGTIRCNCSIYSKSRAWLTTVSAGDFRLLQGAHALGDYQFG